MRKEEKNLLLIFGWSVIRDDWRAADFNDRYYDYYI